jgi:hypothetical protein
MRILELWNDNLPLRTREEHELFVKQIKAEELR